MGDLWLPLLPTWLERAVGADMVLRADGWESASRSTGGYDDVFAIQWHHDAIDQPTWTLEQSIPLHAERHRYAPVGALVLERVTGRWGVIAAGATNTSGKGGPLPCSRGVIPVDSGNRFIISIEAQNNGRGEPWSDDMLDSYALGTAAIIKGLRDDGAYDARRDEFVPIVLDPEHPGDVHAHYRLDGRGYTTRKIDPADGEGDQPVSRYGRSDDPRYGRWDMAAAQSDVAAALARLDNPAPPPGFGGPPVTSPVNPTTVSRPGDVIQYREVMTVVYDPSVGWRPLTDGSEDDAAREIDQGDDDRTFELVDFAGLASARLFISSMIAQLDDTPGGHPGDPALTARDWMWERFNTAAGKA